MTAARGGARGHTHGPGDGHTHGAGNHHHHGAGSQIAHALAGRADVSRRLAWVFAITGVFMVVELVGGLISGSLALLADAGHMFSDVGALGLSIFAMKMAQRPPSDRRTYGLVRLEILAALVNGATLLLIAGWIVVEAWERLREPSEIGGAVMLGVAVVGLAVNAVGALLLHAHAHENLNVRGAYLHVLGDLLGSVGTIVAALVVITTGWTAADPIVSVAIALLILFSAWSLVREATDVLMESVPSHIDMDRVQEALRSIDGLDDVHHIHVWTLTSGLVALSAHGVVDDPKEHTRALQDIREVMSGLGIEHVTFQIEQRPLYQLPGPRVSREADRPDVEGR